MIDHNEVLTPSERRSARAAIAWLGYTQAEYAEELDTDSSTLSLVLNARRKPPKHVAAGLREAVQQMRDEIYSDRTARQVEPAA